MEEQKDGRKDGRPNSVPPLVFEKSRGNKKQGRRMEGVGRYLNPKHSQVFLNKMKIKKYKINT